jgi:NodT family efflux transporter outer membrane factor (OMF) lipoprotein
MTIKRLVVLALLAAAGGCTVGPNYAAPKLTAPPVFAEAQTPPAPGSVGGPDLAQWWTQFNDPQLNDLIRRALADNPDLKTSGLRVKQAREQEIITGAAEYPTLNANANALALRTGGGSVLPSSLNNYSAGFDASWEPDLFGGTRRAIEASRADTQADLWAHRDGQVSLIAEVARDYLTLRALQARIAIDQTELAKQRGEFTLIAARRKAGFTTDLDVNQQSQAVSAAIAQILDLQAQAKAQIHAIAVLLGQPPAALDATLVPNQNGIIVPPELPAGMPSELLSRRPDVREAERKLASATAQIGVQTANLYPKINLMALGTFAGPSIGGLFSHQNLAGIGLGMVTLPIFNGGKTRAAIRNADYGAQAADLAYQSAFLKALREVEDALAQVRADEARRVALAQAVDASRHSLTIAQDQYATGFVTYINVLQAENAVESNEDALIQASAKNVTDMVALYKALGGGWS